MTSDAGALLLGEVDRALIAVVPLYQKRSFLIRLSYQGTVEKNLRNQTTYSGILACEHVNTVADERVNRSPLSEWMLAMLAHKVIDGFTK